jgi:hypothetical protein
MLNYSIKVKKLVFLIWLFSGNCTYFGVISIEIFKMYDIMKVPQFSLCEVDGKRKRKCGKIYRKDFLL